MFEVGDKVTVCGCHNIISSLSTVVRTTKTMVFLNNINTKFNRITGWEVGNKDIYSMGKIAHTTEEDRETVFKLKLIRKLRQIEWQNMPLGFLKSVNDLYDESIKEMSDGQST